MKLFLLKRRKKTDFQQRYKRVTLLFKVMKKAQLCVCANITQLAPRVKEAVWPANSMYQEFHLAVEEKLSTANLFTGVLLRLSNISHHQGYCQVGDRLLQMPSFHIRL